MWRVIPGQELHYREWEDEFVLYNNLSGDTHLLGFGAIHILLTLKQSDADDNALIESMCECLDADRDEEIESQVNSLLRDLGVLALIERVAC